MRTEDEIEEAVKEIDCLLEKYGHEIINEHEISVRRNTLVWVLGKVRDNNEQMDLWYGHWFNKEIIPRRLSEIMTK